VFGKENLTHLLDDRKLLQKLKAYAKKGIYGIADIINDIYCDVGKPENNTIIKPEKYGDGVYIMCDDNRWEYRGFEDIRSCLTDKLSEVFETYNEIRNKLGVKLYDIRERNYMRNMTVLVLSMGGDIPEDLYEELGIVEAQIDEDPITLKAKFKRFDKATMTKLHEYTCPNYKEKEGTYIKNSSHILEKPN
jgi:hypothetical protein